MQVQAKLNYARIAPRKARLVSDLVKGLSVEKAHYQLNVVQKKSGKILSKLLDSAIANAKELGGVDVDSLFVKNITVDGGPKYRRFMPRAMGRATKIDKRTSHITLTLDEMM